MSRFALILIATALAGCATQHPTQQQAVRSCPPDMHWQECEKMLKASNGPPEQKSTFLDLLIGPEPYPFSSLTNHSIMRALGY